MRGGLLYFKKTHLTCGLRPLQKMSFGSLLRCPIIAVR